MTNFYTRPSAWLAIAVALVVAVGLIGSSSRILDHFEGPEASLEQVEDASALELVVEPFNVGIGAEKGPGAVLIVFHVQDLLVSQRLMDRFSSLLDQTGADHRFVRQIGSNVTLEVDRLYKHVVWLFVGEASSATAALQLCNVNGQAAGKMLKPGPDGFCICGGRTFLETRVKGSNAIVKVPATKLVGVGGTRSAMHASSPGTCARGALYAAYELLASIGFDLNKPFAPVAPSLSEVSKVRALESILLAKGKIGTSGIDPVCNSPKLKVRSTHYHTMHPVELADVLNGFGPDGTPGDHDERGFESQLGLYDSFLEWLIVTRQNRFEFALLRADAWADFARSETRRLRLSELVRRAHETCIGIGFDLPLAFVQQHSFALLTNRKQAEEHQAAEIRSNLDWAASTGIDFVGTESGLSEFSHPNCTDMLRWMNVAATHAASAGLPIFIKAHCSTSQLCPEFDNLNFNFLPELAVPQMGVAPHTVQFYSLQDDAPGVYGNTNFTFMRDWMYRMASQGKRDVIYYPETEYWVDFDSPVPIFLPVYARARFLDLRAIGSFQEKAQGKANITGQMNFDSGFEWAYWVNSVVTARASYDPLLDTMDDQKALAELLQDSVTDRIFPQDVTSARRVAQLLVRAMEDHHRFMVASARSHKDDLILGNRTAISFITGYDMYANIGALSSSSNVAAGRVRMEAMGDSSAREFYRAQVRPNLSGLANSLHQTVNDLESFRSASAHNLEEIIDSFNITRLRTEQVLALYDFLAASGTNSVGESEELLEQAEAHVDAARELVNKRSSKYAVPFEAVATWKAGPTVYKYRYLWTAQSLYYWFRDELIARTLSKTRFMRPISPCLRNIENPLEEFLQFRGIAALSKFTEHMVAALGKVPLVREIVDCVNVPDREPQPYSHKDKMPFW